MIDMVERIIFGMIALISAIIAIFKLDDLMDKKSGWNVFSLIYCVALYTSSMMLFVLK